MRLEQIYYCPKRISYIYYKGDVIVDFYEKLPSDFLIAFYDEMMKNIEKGLLTKNMYYEVGLIISVASRRGITLGQPYDFEKIVDQKELNDFFIQLAYKSNEIKDVSHPVDFC
jgi:hypothetical protein